jgi:hypothetical protein
MLPSTSSESSFNSLPLDVQMDIFKWGSAPPDVCRSSAANFRNKSDARGWFRIAKQAHSTKPKTARRSLAADFMLAALEDEIE